MRALHLVLFTLLGCADSFEEPAPAVWTHEKWLAAEDASELWQLHGAKVACEWLDDLRVQCIVRGQTWLMMLAAVPPVIDGRMVGGYASYSRHRLWVWTLHPNILAAAAHELGHALMPIAGNSPTEGHTQTGVMSDGALPVWTDEVLDLCRAEGACR